MGRVIKCFMLEPTDQQENRLRRYAAGSVCAAGPYHDAQAVVGREPFKNEASGDNHPHDDPRWPKSCGCGYRFEDGDQWQWLAQLLYRRSDNGELLVLGAAPPGAMWYADWFADEYKGPDGRCLVVMTPGGEWIADAPSSGGDGWTPDRNPPERDRQAIDRAAGSEVCRVALPWLPDRWRTTGVLMC